MFKSLAIITTLQVFAFACETDLKLTKVERPKLTEESCLSKPEILGCREFPLGVGRSQSHIAYRRYVLSLANIFIVSYPKPREIIAAQVSDWLVHHFI